MGPDVGARLRTMLDGLSRPVLYRLARGVAAEITPSTKRGQLVDVVSERSVSYLRHIFANSIAIVDLREICRRFGYSDAGSSTKLANRLMDAVEARDARITRWRPFADAREFARGLELRSQIEWRRYAQGKQPGKPDLPRDVPAAPWLVYKRAGWTNLGDFLGTHAQARRSTTYRSFAKARAYARGLGFSNAVEWKQHCSTWAGNRRALPADIPSAPGKVYADRGWVGFGDWLGTGHVHASRIRYRTYDEARAFVGALGIRTEPEWRAYCRGEIHRTSPRPLDIPSNPHRTYRNKCWTSWGEFLGTGSVALYARTFRPYRDAVRFVREQGLRDSKDWRAWCAAGKRPMDIPGAPDAIYRGKGWSSWGAFFGNENVHPERMRWKTLRESMSLVRRLGIRSRAEFLAARHAGRIPRDVPVTIDRRPGWPGWSAFLGTD